MKKKIRFQLLCVSCGVLSLVFANGAGSYIFQLMDSFAGNYTLLIIAFFEVSASGERWRRQTDYNRRGLIRFLSVHFRELRLRVATVRR